MTNGRHKYGALASPRSKSFQTRTDALRGIRQTGQELDQVGLTYYPSVLERMNRPGFIRGYLV